MEHPVGAKAIEMSVAAGEEARILPRIGMKLKIIDEAVAMLPLTPTGMSGALVVRSPVIINALRAYFEMLWERATPLSGTRPDDGLPISEAQSEVLRLLAQGLMDEAIARRTNNSVQTVRRHVATLKELLQVETRFAAGAAAIRKGWIQ
jgi:DNA-binding CsgD family transcriptional regulator